jgi:hypothetical protein
VKGWGASHLHNRPTCYALCLRKWFSGRRSRPLEEARGGSRWKCEPKKNKTSTSNWAEVFFLSEFNHLFHRHTSKWSIDLNRRFWDEIIAYFPLIRHGPRRKRKIVWKTHRCPFAYQRLEGQQSDLTSVLLFTSQMQSFYTSTRFHGIFLEDGGSSLLWKRDHRRNVPKMVVLTEGVVFRADKLAVPETHMFRSEYSKCCDRMTERVGRAAANGWVKTFPRQRTQWWNCWKQSFLCDPCRSYIRRTRAGDPCGGGLQYLHRSPCES